ncbi:hypothetical protein ABEW05_007367 [Botrytis cinerea]
MVPDHLATRTLHFDALLACSYHHHQPVNAHAGPLSALNQTLGIEQTWVFAFLGPLGNCVVK